MYELKPQPRPRGAPKMGARVRVEIGFGDDWIEGKVIEFLSKQFVIEKDDGALRVIGVSESWKEM